MKMNELGRGIPHDFSEGTTELKNLSKSFGSWSKVEPRIQEEMKREIEVFSKFVGKKVSITVRTGGVLGTLTAVLKGRILTYGGNSFVFVERGDRKRGKRITLGLYDGFFATLTVDKIVEGW